MNTLHILFHTFYDNKWFKWSTKITKHLHLNNITWMKIAEHLCLWLPMILTSINITKLYNCLVLTASLNLVTLHKIKHWFLSLSLIWCPSSIFHFHSRWFNFEITNTLFLLTSVNNVSRCCSNGTDFGNMDQKFVL